MSAVRLVSKAAKTSKTEPASAAICLLNVAMAAWSDSSEPEECSLEDIRHVVRAAADLLSRWMRGFEDGVPDGALYDALGLLTLVESAIELGAKPTNQLSTSPIRTGIDVALGMLVDIHARVALRALKAQS